MSCSMVLFFNPFKESLPVEQYLISMLVFFSSGYPLASAYVFIIFGKILGKGDHGLQIGIQTAVGALARIFGPVLSMTLYEVEKWPLEGEEEYQLTGRFVWMTGFLIMILSVCLTIYTWGKLVEHKTCTNNSR